MHIETLKIFCDLVDSNSFLKAGEKNLLSQSAVSQQLAHLEATYNAQLLDRKRKPFKLTGAGALFYNAAKDMLGRFEQFNSDLDSLRKSVANRISIAAIYSIGMHSLPPFVKAFMAKYADVNVHIEYLGARQIHEAVLRRTVDIGLVAMPPSDRNLEVYDFGNEPLVLVCNPEHALAIETEVDVRQLDHQRFIGFEERIPTRALIDSILAKYDVSVQRMMVFDNIETVKRAVEIDAGVSILPETAIRQELANGTLAAVPFADDGFVRPTGIIVRKGDCLSKPGQFLLELLRGRRVVAGLKTNSER